MLQWQDGLKVTGCGLYLDGRVARASAVVSHAHADHLPVGGTHDVTLATPFTIAVGRWRRGIGESDAAVVPLQYRQAHRFDPDTELTLYPAGHVAGSAMTLLRRPEGSLLYTGDFKLRASRTIETADPPRADVLVTESTYGLPQFRFPPPGQTIDRLCSLVADALRDGRQPVVLCYALGKAQEACRILTDTGFVVTQHGATANLTDLHLKAGIDVGDPTLLRRYREADFDGPSALPLEQRGVLLAPPRVVRTAFVGRFVNPLRLMLSGWALTPGATYRYGVDEVLPLSDHGDFGELLDLIERVSPKVIYTHHGFPAFVDELRRRGHDARLARPEPQMTLFG